MSNWEHLHHRTCLMRHSPLTGPGCICKVVNSGALQNRLVDAVEMARSLRIASGNASPDYDLGYAAAKRDVLVELAQVFATELT